MPKEAKPARQQIFLGFSDVRVRPVHHTSRAPSALISPDIRPGTAWLQLPCTGTGRLTDFVFFFAQGVFESQH